MAETKEQILSYFNSLDTSTLQKLKKYSEYFIIPDEDLLTNVTMTQMVDKAHSLADSLFPEWTDRSKSDFGEFLVELFAVFSEKDFWYVNAFANEGLLSKMHSYSNVFSLASSLGYSPTICKSARGYFNVTFQQGETTTYGKGDLIVDISGTKFTNAEDFVVEASDSETTMNLLLYEGEQMSEDFTYNGHNVYVTKMGVDLDSVEVTIDNVLFTRVGNFGNSGIDSSHFMVLPEKDGSFSIYFGTDGFGVQPAIGKAIRIDYRKCSGSAGNINTLSMGSINSSLTERKATEVLMSTRATDGTDAESLSSIKYKTPLFFKTKRAAINERTSQDLLNSFAFVKKSKVYVQSKNVYYHIIPTSGQREPSASELQSLRELFEPYIMLGYQASYSPNDYIDICTQAEADKIIVRAVISDGYNADAIKDSIKHIMADLTNPLVKAEYGKGFNGADADIYIRSLVRGVLNVAFYKRVSGSESLIGNIDISANDIFQTILPEELEVEIQRVNY